jgi:hypothetical protein
MALRSGHGGQLAFKAETTLGTPVTPDTFLPFIGESIDRAEDFVETESIYANRLVMQSTQWNAGSVTVKGAIKTELFTASVKPLLKAMFGSETGAGPFTYTPADLWGNGLTIQVGRPGMNGTVQPFTYSGMKCETWQIDCAVGQTAKLTASFSGALVDEATATALAAASYTAGIRPFTFVGASIALNSASVPVNSLTLSGDNKLNSGRRFLGSRFISEQSPSKLRDYKGTLSAEFTDTTIYALYLARTEVPLVATFVSGATQLVITMNVRLNGKTPNLEGMDVVKQSIPFTCVASGADATAITAVYTP